MRLCNIRIHRCADTEASLVRSSDVSTLHMTLILSSAERKQTHPTTEQNGISTGLMGAAMVLDSPHAHNDSQKYTYSSNGRKSINTAQRSCGQIVNDSLRMLVKSLAEGAEVPNTASPAELA